MSKNNIKLIVNPNADLGRAWRWASDLRPVVDEFGGADWSGTVYPTHAKELALQAVEAGYETIVAVGGDGTVHEVINGLMQVPVERRPRLGIVPLGSGNDFASALGIDSHATHALRQFFNGKPRKIDVAEIKDNLGRCEYVDNTLGIGFDATVTIRSRNVPLVRGFFVYLIAVLQTVLLNHDAVSMHISTDQESWDDQMLMLTLCNGGREGGGFAVAPQARPDDSWLHYAGVRRVSRPMMLRLIPEVMRGTHGRFPQVRMGQFRRMELDAEQPLIIHADGEIFAGFGMDVHRLLVEIHSAAVEVVC